MSLYSGTKSRQDSFLVHPYLLLAGGANIYLLASIVHVYRTPGYLPVFPMLHLLWWALAVNVASSLVVSLCRFRFDWTVHSTAVGLLDIASSLFCLVLIRCVRIPDAEPRLHTFGYAYALFVFTKLALLTWYGWANVHRKDETLNRLYVFAVALVIYLGISPWTKFACWPTGDEPHYLLLSYSLFYDHDFDLANNYAHQDYRGYFPVPLPDTHAVKTKTGQAMLWHDVGTSILLVPGYALDQRLGAMLEMSGFATSIALAIYILSVFLGAGPPAAMLTAMLFCFTAPMSVFASQIFPEVIGAGLCLWTLVALSFYMRHGRRRPLILAGSLIGIMPWICIRFWMLAGPLFLVIAGRVIYTRRSSLRICFRELMALGLPVLGFVSAFSAFDMHFFGTPLPNAGYFAIASSYPQFVAHPLVGAFGMLMDRAAGLLPVTPLYILVLAGLLKVRRDSWMLAAMLSPSLSYFIFMCFARNWAGGWCPQGRYILGVVIPCAPIAALALQNVRRRVLVFGLAAWSLATAIIFTALPLLRYPSTPDFSIGGLNQYVASQTGMPVWLSFPSLTVGSYHDWLLVGLWCGIFAVCIWSVNQ